MGRTLWAEPRVLASDSLPPSPRALVGNNLVQFTKRLWAPSLPIWASRAAELGWGCLWPPSALAVGVQPVWGGFLEAVSGGGKMEPQVFVVRAPCL